MPDGRGASMDLFLGIDAGASHTVCLVGDRTSVLGRGEAGPANPTVVGVAGFGRAVAEATRAAFDSAATGPAPVAAAWIGAAGSERPSMLADLVAAAAGVLDASRIEVSHDARLLLAAADMDDGVALVCGTGSSCYGRDARGRGVTVGGWGHLLGDEGSAYDIARAALRAVTQAADGRGRPTVLTDAVLARFGLDDPFELRERLYPAPAVAEVAPIATDVMAAALAGDGVATAIVNDAAADVARAVSACIRALGTQPPQIVLAGGLLQPGSPLEAAVCDRLSKGPLTEDVPVVVLRIEPAVGALALARQPPVAHSTLTYSTRALGPQLGGGIGT